MVDDEDMGADQLVQINDETDTSPFFSVLSTEQIHQTNATYVDKFA